MGRLQAVERLTNRDGGRDGRRDGYGVGRFDGFGTATVAYSYFIPQLGTKKHPSFEAQTPDAKPPGQG